MRSAVNFTHLLSSSTTDFGAPYTFSLALSLTSSDTGLPIFFAIVCKLMESGGRKRRRKKKGWKEKGRVLHYLTMPEYSLARPQR